MYLHSYVWKFYYSFCYFNKTREGFSITLMTSFLYPACKLLILQLLKRGKMRQCQNNGIGYNWVSLEFGDERLFKRENGSSNWRRRAQYKYPHMVVLEPDLKSSCDVPVMLLNQPIATKRKRCWGSSGRKKELWFTYFVTIIIMLIIISQ